MLGRRSHARYLVGGTGEGVFRVLTDVAVVSKTPDEMHVIGREAAAPGEIVAVHLLEGDVTLTARVRASRPVIVNGAVRHRIELAVLGQADAAGEAGN